MTLPRLHRFMRILLSSFFALSVALQGIQPAAAQDRGNVRIHRSPQTGKVTFVGAPAGSPINVPGAQSPGLAEQDRAMAMILPYAADFGLKQADRELKLAQRQAVPGRKVDRFQQVYQGIPVMAGELVVNATDQGSLLSINGEISPDLSVDTTPAVSAQQAEQTALRSMVAWKRGAGPQDFNATQPELWIYDARLLQPDGSAPSLVWRMDVTSKDASVPLRELVLVDAHYGNVLLHFNQVDTEWARSSRSGLQDEPPTPPTENPAPTEAPAVPAAVQAPLDALTGTLRYVATTGTDSGACTSSLSPCLTINYAITQSVSGDTINLAQGTYTSTGPHVADVTKSLSIQGGWDPGFSTHAGQSVIDGQAAHIGVYVVGGSLTVSVSQVAVQNGYPFGVYNNNGNGTLSFDRSALINNTGNGIYNYVGNVNFTNTTISGNHSAGYAGAAISNVDGLITIQFSTITNNSGYYDHAIYSANGFATEQMGNSILAGNGYADCWGNITSTGHNIFGHSPPCDIAITTQPTDQVGVNPQLASLTPAGFHPLISTSPAINAAGTPCPATDQRGFSRPYGASCDIGAYEYAPAGPAASITVSAGSGQHAAPLAQFPQNLAAYVADSTGAPVPGATVTFTAPASGASGTFADFHNRITTANTGPGGVATAAAFSANLVLGSYAVSATTSGVAGSADFSLTNQAWFVDPARPDDTGDCASPVTACKTINGAIGKAAAGDGILVRTGTYTGAGTAVVTISKAVTLSGGWNSGFTALDGYSILDGQNARQVVNVTASSGTLTISRFVIQNGSTTSTGAGIASPSSSLSLVLQNSSVSNNVSTGWQGGGIDARSLELDNSTVSNNSVIGASYAYGGGIYTNTLLMNNSTISGNSAQAPTVGEGGGIFVSSGSTTINNSTIVKNQATHSGGGIFGTGLVIRNTILTNNQVGGSGAKNCYGSVSTADHDLLGDMSSCPLGSSTGNITGDPRLTPVLLGTPPYHALFPDSPAINAGNPSTCLGTDERGISRPQGSACDIGAFEYGFTGTLPAYVFPYRGSRYIRLGLPAPAAPAALVVDAAGLPVAGVSVTFTAPASGPGGTFGNGTGTIVVATDVNGIANSGTFTANGTAGSYTVQASAAGVVSPAAFSITNLSGDIRTYTMNHSQNYALLPGAFLCDLTNYNCTNGLDSDADYAEQYALDTYLYYQSHLNRNSVDNAGLPLISSVHFGSGFQNAFWDGYQMVYGDGFSTGLDVVGHELTHGVTQYTSGLFYYYQSGAINESMSDVFGELIQRSHSTTEDNWLMGEDLPIGAIRSMKDPTLFGDPDKMSSGNYAFDPGEYDNGGVHSNSGINNKAAYLMAAGGFFNGKTVAPVGEDKTAAVYYEVNTHLLTSGSDYGDLYVDLYQACLNLMGGAAGVTLADCQSVQDAVDAVQMNGQPAAAPSYNTNAPVCSAGNAPVPLFSDSFESGAGNWTLTSNNTQRWQMDSQYGPNAHSGLHSLYGDVSGGVPTDASAAMKVGVPLPANAYLWFAQAYDFEHYYYYADPNNYDGGVLEYSANGGAWTDAGSLMEYNGYNGPIASGYFNPLAGRQGFVGPSHGYISTRLNLASLAGQSVRFRWRIGLDNYGFNWADYGWIWGWWLDDVQIYTCSPFTGHKISGNAGVAGATLSYTDGTPKTATADGTGNYSFAVSNGWSGTLTPSAAGYWFTPPNRSYSGLAIDRMGQNFTASNTWYGGISITSNRNIVAVGRPHVGAEVASYDGFASGSLTAFVPMLFKNAWGSYDSALYVQNLDSTHPAHVTVKYYDSSGNLSCSKDVDTIDPLSSHGYWVPSETCLPVGWVGGAVVTSSDYPIVAVARPHVGSEVMTYNGFSSGSTASFLPMLFKHAFGSYDSAFYVQNVDGSHSAQVTIKYYDTNGALSCEKPIDTIAPLASHGYWVPSETCLPASWVGGVVVTSDYPIVAVARPHIGTQVTTYDGFASGSLGSYVPMLFKNAFGGSYDSALYVQNVDPNLSHSAHITIDYYDSYGSLSCHKTGETIDALSSKGYWVPAESCLPAGWVGGAVVTSSDYPVVAVGRPHVGAQVTAYDGFTGGSGSMSLPMLFKNMWGSYNSAFYVQNTDQVNAADVTVKFYDASGNLSCTRIDTIPAKATLGYWVPSVTCNGP